MGNMNNDLQVIIPIKTDSSRCPNKNLRAFYNGMSLLEIKIVQALEVVASRQLSLCVSPVPGPALRKRWETIHRMAETYGLRVIEEAFSAQSVSFFRSQFLRIKKAQRPDITIFYLVTMPFLGSKSLARALSQLEEEGSDLLLTTQPLEGQIFNHCGKPVNFSRFSFKGGQFIRRYQMVQSGIAIVRRNFSILRPKVSFFSPERCRGIDINSEEDWEFAQFLARHEENRRSIEAVM